jgi:hypothetical protein
VISGRVSYKVNGSSEPIVLSNSAPYHYDNPSTSIAFLRMSVAHASSVSLPTPASKGSGTKKATTKKGATKKTTKTTATKKATKSPSSHPPWKQVIIVCHCTTMLPCTGLWMRQDCIVDHPDEARQGVSRATIKKVNGVMLLVCSIADDGLFR